MKDGGDIKMQREETCQVEAAGPLIDCRFNVLIAASLLVIASEKMIPFGHTVSWFIGRLRRLKLIFRGIRVKHSVKVTQTDKSAGLKG